MIGFQRVWKTSARSPPGLRQAPADGEQYLIRELPGLPDYFLWVIGGVHCQTVTVLKSVPGEELLQSLPPVPGMVYTAGERPGWFWYPGTTFESRFMMAYTKRALEQQRGFQVRVSGYLAEHPRLREYGWVAAGVALMDTDMTGGRADAQGRVPDST